MNEKITFSVIMPCYNSESYLRGALDSVVNQTWPHWELIAVNDGSKDSTPEILREYAEKDPRVRVFSKENGGYVSAVNYGLDHIRGDYFLLMGSDDALNRDLFQNLARSVGEELPHCIAFQTEIIQNGENLGVESITQYRESCRKDGTTLAAFAEEYPAQAEIFFTRDTSKCYHRSLLGDLRYFGRYGLDADGIFSMLLCHKATSFQALTVVGYYWTKREDSISGRKRSFLQQCDCVANWTLFFREILNRGYALASTEVQYLHYLIGLLQVVAAEATGDQLELIREAAAVIQNITDKTGLDLDLSKKNRLLLKAPKAWKLLNRFL